MNHDEIMQLEVGRELDALVAERVMGQADLEHPGFFWTEGTTEDGKDGWDGFYCPRCGASEGTTEKCAKGYSTDIAAAWQVVEKMVANGHEVFVSVTNNQWNCMIADDSGEPGVNILMTELGTAHEATAPLAICRAALMAVEIER